MPDPHTLVDRLTLAEKIDLVHGSVDPDGTATGYVPGNDRVGIPPLRLVDGPLGVRALGHRATAFPASIALAASWNPDLARRFGSALGRETTALGQDVLLGPGVNIARVPEGGRNFEYYGEDPHLASRLAVGTIEGIQSAEVAATVKHFVANNQETNRYEVSADVDERTLREIYLPAFRAAVEEAEVHAVMSAYNRVNGVHMSDHGRLLTDVLRDEWGFEGVVVSDWWGTRSTVDAALAGVDLEMPGVSLAEFLPDDAEAPAGEADGPAGEVDDSDGDADDSDDPALPPQPDGPAYFDEPLREAVEAGDVDEAVIDEKVERHLVVMDAIGALDERTSAHAGGSRSDGRQGELDSDRHRALAREVAVAGTVMLTNDGALPLDPDDSVAVIGPNVDAAKLGGGGSSEVTPFVETSPLDGVRDAAISEVPFERGIPRIAESSFFDDGPEAERDPESTPSIDDAVETAADVDCAVVVVQDDATEFRDRPGLELPGRQDELVGAVTDAADRCVVVLRASGPVETPWIDAVDAALVTWYPGQADGEALADVLFGDADPGGRLPVTFGRSADDYPTASAERFPGVDDVASYSEGVFVGYRHFDAEDRDPAFTFGHGESYANWTYDAVTVTDTSSGFELAVDLANAGDRAGTEVVQAYVDRSPAPVPTPDRELVGFARLSLEPGETTTVRIPVDREELAYYDDGWRVAPGEYPVHVGRSVRDGRVSTTLSVDGEREE